METLSLCRPKVGHGKFVCYISVEMDNALQRIVVFKCLVCLPIAIFAMSFKGSNGLER